MKKNLVSTLADAAARCVLALRGHLSSVGVSRPRSKETMAPASVEGLVLVRPLFDEAWYLRQYPDVGAAGDQALLHYLEIGAARGYAPHPLFDGAWYLEQHPEVARAGINPLIHYLQEGAALGYSPSLAFDSAWYLYRNPDVAAAKLNPLVHFVLHGMHEGRPPNPFDEVAAFDALARSGDAIRAVRLLDWRQHLLPQDGTLPYVATLTWGDISDVSEPGPLATAASPGSSAGLYEFVALNAATVIGGTESVIVADRFIPTNARATEKNDRASPGYRDAWKKGETAFVRFKRKSRTYITLGIHLTSDTDRTYAGYLTSILPRLLAIQSCAIPPGAALLVSDSADEREKAALRIVSGSDRPVIALAEGVAYATDLLYYPVKRDGGCTQGKAGGGSPLEGEAAALMQVRERVLSSVIKADHGRTRRFYVRSSDQSQCFSNDREFCTALIDRNFEIVAVESLAFEIQVRLFASSSIVILHAGEDFANALWCHPGSHIIVIEDPSGRAPSNLAMERVVAGLATVHTIRPTFDRPGDEEYLRPLIQLDAMTRVLDDAIQAIELPTLQAGRNTGEDAP